VIEISVDAEVLEAAMRRLEKVPYAMQRAIIPAVSEMMQRVRDQLAAYLRSDVPLPDKLAVGAIRLLSVRLQGNSVAGEIVVRSPMIPLIYYDVQPATITARPGMPSRRWPGFTYALRSGERRGSLSRIFGAGLPFVARMPGGHLGVYFRTGSEAKRPSGLWGKGAREVKAHQAIKEDYGPSVQYHIANPQVEQVLINRAEEAFPVILSKYVEQAIATHAEGEKS
jgi:hypothetical protein